MIVFQKQEDDLEEINQYIRDYFKGDGIVLLRGNLAAGKTTLVKSFVKFLGLKDDVTSPTFSIMQSYSNIIFHYDIYNKGLQEFLSIGLLENLGLEGYHFIEWADEKFERVLKDFMFDYLVIEIETKQNIRIYKIRGNNESSVEY